MWRGGLSVVRSRASAASVTSLVYATSHGQNIVPMVQILVSEVLFYLNSGNELLTRM